MIKKLTFASILLFLISLIAIQTQVSAFLPGSIPVISHFGSGSNTSTTAFITSWQQSFNYEQKIANSDFVYANGNTYKETVEFCTSASTGSGPSGTGIGITDGTCSWNYVATGQSFVVPSNYVNGGSSVKVIGGGGGGDNGNSLIDNYLTSGGGGAYAAISSFSTSATTSIAYQIGTGGAGGSSSSSTENAGASGTATYFNGSTCTGASICAAPGAGGGTGGSAGLGGTTAASVGSTKYAGGNSGEAPLTSSGSGSGTVSVDAVSSSDVEINNASDSSPQTISNITVGTGANRALVVGIAGASPLGTNLSVVWDAGGTNQTMTPILNTSVSQSAAQTQAAVFYGLVAPTSGNKTLQISWSSGVLAANVFAISFTNVNQSGGATSFPNGTTATGTDSPISVNQTVSTGQIALAIYADPDQVINSTNQTNLYIDNNNSAATATAMDYSTSTGSVTFNAPMGGTSDYGWVASSVDIAGYGSLATVGSPGAGGAAGPNGAGGNGSNGSTAHAYGGGGGASDGGTSASAPNDSTPAGGNGGTHSGGSGGTAAHGGGSPAGVVAATGGNGGGGGSTTYASGAGSCAYDFDTIHGIGSGAGGIGTNGGSTQASPSNAGCYGGGGGGSAANDTAPYPAGGSGGPGLIAFTYLCSSCTNGTSGPTPTIASVTSTPTTGTTIGIGGSVTITANISEPVTVSGGTPCLNLSNGATACYSSVSSTSTSLVFVYTVSSSQATSDLETTSSSYVANGATIQSSSSVALTNFASLNTYNTGLIITNTSAPTISSVSSSTGSGTYGSGTVIGIIVTFNQSVTLGGTGTPTIALNSGVTAEAIYSTGSGTSTWTFDYTVGSNDNANPLETTNVAALTLGSATIKNSGGLSLASSAPLNGVSFTGVDISTSTYACPGSGGTHYYWATNGNDGSNGTSPSTPFQSISKLNSGSITFKAGDCITFRGGDNFSGNPVFAYESSFGNNTNLGTMSSTNPIVINSSSFGGGTSANASFTSTSGGYGGSVNGGLGSATFMIVNGTGFYVTGITALNGTGQGSNATTQGITAVNGNYITITGNTAYGFQFANGDNPCCSSQIRVENGANITITNNNIPGLGQSAQEGLGIYTRGITGPDTIAGNNISNIAGSSSSSANGWTGEGISIAGTGPFLVYSNKVFASGGNATGCGGPSGIIAYTASNGIIYNNEVANSQPYSGSAPCDFDGIDIDGGINNFYVERNYTHGNYGNGLTNCAGCAGESDWGPNWSRWNLSINDATGPGSTSTYFGSGITSGTAVLYFYGNTVIQNQTVTGQVHGVFGFGGGGGILTAGTYVGNNIFGITSGNTFAACNNYGDQPNLATITWGPNLYYLINGASFQAGNDIGGNPPCTGSVKTSLSTWKSAIGDTQSFQGTPSFSGGDPSTNSAQTCSWTASNGTGPQSCPTAYQLTHGSAALGTGVNPASFVGSPSEHTPDYYGVAIPNSGCIGTSSSGGSGYNIGPDNTCR